MIELRPEEKRADVDFQLPPEDVLERLPPELTVLIFLAECRLC